MTMPPGEFANAHVVSASVSPGTVNSGLYNVELVYYAHNDPEHLITLSYDDVLPSGGVVQYFLDTAPTLADVVFD